VERRSRGAGTRKKQKIIYKALNCKKVALPCTRRKEVDKEVIRVYLLYIDHALTFVLSQGQLLYKMMLEIDRHSF
jgi:hypothetical protein